MKSLLNLTLPLKIYMIAKYVTYITTSDSDRNQGPSGKKVKKMHSNSHVCLLQEPKRPLQGL